MIFLPVNISRIKLPLMRIHHAKGDQVEVIRDNETQKEYWFLRSRVSDDVIDFTDLDPRYTYETIETVDHEQSVGGDWNGTEVLRVGDTEFILIVEPWEEPEHSDLTKDGIIEDLSIELRDTKALLRQYAPKEVMASSNPDLPY